ncbi:MAG: RsmB/NOP family class I SAM-dependent RNA methyltransferase [Myxococcota bacterium]
MIDLLRCALPAEPQPALADAVSRPFIRDAVVEGLAEARAHPRYAGPTLSRWFRRTRRLGSRDRRVVAEAVHGVLRHAGILARAGATTDAERLAAWGRLVGGERFDVLSSTTPEADYAAALSLPEPIASEWLRRLGPADAARLGAALAARAPTTIRANLRRGTRAQLSARLGAEGVETHPTARAPHGLMLNGRANLVGTKAFRAGWFEVQDEASQLLCEAIGAAPGMAVMDLCAGAGGKSLALAAAGATVYAHDIRSNALDELRRRAKRAGVQIPVTGPRMADVVLIDAPCSGTGRLRRDPAMRLGLPALDLDALWKTQRSLIAQGTELVEPGGRLIYATCSLLSAENDHDLPGWTLTEAVTLWPHEGGMDGFGWRIWKKD